MLTYYRRFDYHIKTSISEEKEHFRVCMVTRVLHSVSIPSNKFHISIVYSESLDVHQEIHGIKYYSSVFVFSGQLLDCHMIMIRLELLHLIQK